MIGVFVAISGWISLSDNADTPEILVVSVSSLFRKVGDKWAGPLSAEGPLGFYALVVAGPADRVTTFLFSFLLCFLMRFIFIFIFVCNKNYGLTNLYTYVHELVYL